jgi:hypothetical protein
MSKRGKKDVDEQLVLALAAGAGVATAAKQAMCSEKTVRRRLAEPGFRAKISAMRSQLVEGAVGRLATMGTLAADELLHLMQNGKDDNVKLGASRSILSFMLTGHANELMAREVAEIREHLARQHERGLTP